MYVHVTGATGFLGRELLALATRVSSERVEIRDAAAVTQLFARVRPDAVIHTAYRQDGPGAREIVVDGSENVARAARLVGARLVHVSSDVVFGGRAGRPYREDDPPSPCSAYGAAKAEAEVRVADVHADAAIVRTSLLLGGPGHPPSKHELAARDPSATWFEDELRSPILVGDLARALLELTTLGRTGVLHVAGADGLSRAELAELVCGRPVRRAAAPSGRPLDCRLDSSAAQAILRTKLRGVRSVLGG